MPTRWTRRRLVVGAIAIWLLGACSEGGSTSRDSAPDVATTAEPPSATTACVARTDVIVFVNPAIGEPATAAIDAALRELPGVESLSYVDQQMAYEEFQRLFADNPEMLANVQPEVLPPSFRVTVDDPARVQEVTAAAEALDGVGQVVPAPVGGVC